MYETRQSFLETLKEHGIKNKIPNISEETAGFLQFMIWLKKAKSILEIGACNGYSTIWLADATEAFDGHVTSFELSKPQYEEALENFKKAGLSDRITLRLGDFTEEAVVGQWCSDDTQYDLIFMDGQKSDYHVFWELVKPMMHEQTLVIVDDVLKFKEKCQMFWDAVEGETDYVSHIVQTDEDDGVMLLQRK
ncbi:MAG TPA: class I SAM-dependent methyltransferase [Candidatus Gracilibacteria bacterium]